MTSSTAPTAGLPGTATGRPPVLWPRAYAYWAVSYRRTWRASLFSSFLGPVVYLAAIGYGIGGLVDHSGRPGVGGVPYAVFIAPGLLTASLMQAGVGEASWPVLGAVQWQRQYHAMVATPLRPVDVLAGHLAMIVTRLALVGAVFVVAGAVLGAFTSWAAVPALAVAVLCGLAHAAPMMGFSVRQERPDGFPLIYRLGVVPLFLFAGTFFPVDQLPAAIRPIAWLTPLWNGTQAARDLVLGQASAGALLVHVAVMLVWVAAGVAVAVPGYRGRLVA
jgi:lipooligosaccharide transport system permease protein